MTRNCWRHLFAFLFVFLLSPAQGQQLVDQSYTGEAGGGLTTTTGTQGQSFTPTLNGIDFATFKISDYDTAAPGGKISVGISKGNNGSGAGIAYTSSLIIPPNRYLDPHLYTFTFSERVELIPGQIYTLSFLVESGDFGVGIDSGNPYAGGNFYSNTFTPHEDTDAYFVEGIFVPEPVGTAFLTIAVLFGCARRGILPRRPARAT